MYSERTDEEVSSLNQENFRTGQPQDQSVILVVTRTSSLSDAAMNYSLNVAGRLNHRILVAYVNTMPFLRLGGSRRERFNQGVDDNIAVLKMKAGQRNVVASHVKESGKIGKVVNRLCRIVKKIDFVIIDDGVRVEEVVSRCPVPVFNVDMGCCDKKKQPVTADRRISQRLNSSRSTL